MIFFFVLYLVRNIGGLWRRSGTWATTWSWDPGICTVGSVAIGKVSHAGTFRCDNLAKMIPQSSKLEAGRGVDNSTPYNVLLSRSFQQLQPLGENSRRGQHSDRLWRQRTLYSNWPFTPRSPIHHMTQLVEPNPSSRTHSLLCCIWPLTTSNQGYVRWIIFILIIYLAPIQPRTTH